MHKILENPFITNSDIMAVLKCSATKASRIKSKIKQRLAEQGKKIETTEIPTKVFLDFMCFEREQ